MEQPTEPGFYLAYPHIDNGSGQCDPYIVSVFVPDVDGDTTLMYWYEHPLASSFGIGLMEDFEGVWISQVSTIAF